MNTLVADEQDEMEAMLPREQKGEDLLLNNNSTTSPPPSSYFRSFSSNGRGITGLGRIFTHSHAFQILVNKAFEVCDDDGCGTVDPSELYAGLLLVHLNLAKYAGPAACYPPSRHVCNVMFQAADKDHSGSIDRDEFTHIMSVLCAQILSRIVVYYIVLILLVPIIATKIVDMTGILEGSYLELAANQTTSLSLFFIAIPLIWNKIDEQSERRLKQRQQQQQQQQHEQPTVETKTKQEIEIM